MQTVYVHAWEYVNPGVWDRPTAGGGGFNWYPEESEARGAFMTGFDPGNAKNTGDFYFSVKVKGKNRDSITNEIDADLIKLTAKASTRRIGANVLRYWKAGKFKMGTATRAA